MTVLIQLAGEKNWPTEMYTAGPAPHKNVIFPKNVISL